MSNKKIKEKSDVGLLELKSLVESNKVIDDYNDSLEKIQIEISDIFNSYGTIGKELNKIKISEAYKIDGYGSIYDLSKDKFELSETTTKNIIAVYNRFFDKESYYVKLLPEFKDYSFSKLVEMVSMSQDEIKQLSSSSTVKEIRSVKLETKVEKEIDDLIDNPNFLKDIIEDLNKYDFDRFNKGISFNTEPYKDNSSSHGISLGLKISFLFTEYPKLKSSLIIGFKQDADFDISHSSNLDWFYYKPNMSFENFELSMLLDEYFEKILPKADDDVKRKSLREEEKKTGITLSEASTSKKMFSKLKDYYVNSVTWNSFDFYLEKTKNNKSKPLFNVSDFNDFSNLRLNLYDAKGKEIIDSIKVFEDVNFEDLLKEKLDALLAKNSIK